MRVNNVTWHKLWTLTAICLSTTTGVIEAAKATEVEGQPLAQNIARTVQGLESIGQPLDPKLLQQLRPAITAEDAARLQKLIDPLVLAHVHINPESRVKVQRGQQAARLQQSGHTAFLVKIVNEATVTKRLRVTSPQAGPVYGGPSLNILQRQAQTELAENELKAGQPRRFLQLRVHNRPPSTDTLSGLEVEYRILLVYSAEQGKRAATLHFDVGQGTEDLGFRAELPILFDVAPAVPVRLSIRDEAGRPSTARLELYDRDGRVYPPQASRLAPDFFFQKQVYRHDGEQLTLPPGEFSVYSSRGPEYRVKRQQLIVPAPADRPVDAQLEIQLERWINPLAFGYAGGDHHIHAAGCSHYTLPTQGVEPADMFRQVKGEGLNVGCVLTWGPCFDHQRQFFGRTAHALSEPHTILKYDLEISGFGSQALGHVCLLNLQDQEYPGSAGTHTRGWPSWTTPAMRWARNQGGVTGYAHSASGLWIDVEKATQRLLAEADRDSNAVLNEDESARTLLPEPFTRIDTNRDQRISPQELLASHRRAEAQLPNLAVPEMNGVGAMEIFVSSAEGECDFISAMDTRRIQEWNTWYHLLNCGFPLKASGETDFPCMSSTRVGQGRVYVKVSDRKSLNYSDWCGGIRAGRSYVSDGYAHALEFKVNGSQPGDPPVLRESPGPVNVTATVAFAPQIPVAIAHGTLDAPRHLQGDTVHLHGQRHDQLEPAGQRLVELIVNGQPVAKRMVPADGQLHELSFQQVEISQSSWVALRQFPQMHTNPVNVLIDRQPIRASAESARWCQAATRLLWKNRESRIREAERSDARSAFDRALATFEQIESECRELAGQGYR